MISNKTDIVAKYRLFEDMMDLLKHTADKEHAILDKMNQLDRSGNWNEAKYRTLEKEFIKESNIYNDNADKLQQRGKKETDIDIFTTTTSKFMEYLDPSNIDSNAYPECKRIYRKIRDMDACIIFLLYKDDNSYNRVYFDDYNALAQTFNRLREAFLNNVKKGLFKKNIFESIQLI